jgi:hypothetical protein
MSLSKPRRFCRNARQTPSRRNRFLKLGFEGLEQRYCMAAAMGDGLSEMSAPVISEQQAIALALNQLAATDEGFVLQNRRHSAAC